MKNLKSLATVERERERESYNLIKINKGENTFISDVYKKDRLL